MSIVRNFNLYLNAGNGSAPYINANQYDQGEQWVFTLYKEDGTKYTPGTGAIVGIKADNRGIINTGTVDSEGRVVINETQQMTAAAGIAIFELLIDGDSHGTANFLVNVEQRPGDNADLSDSDLSLIQQAVDAASEIEDLLGGQDVPTVITPIISDWLDENITNPSNPPIDTSLTVAGAAADAKKTGDEITDLKSAINTLSQIVYDENIVNNALKQEGRIKYNTGLVQAGTGYYCTDYVQIFQGVTYLFRGGKSNFAFYDKSKTYYTNTSSDITTFNGGTIRGFSDNLNCNYFVAPIDGYVRLTTNILNGNIWMCAIKALTDDTSSVDITKPNEYFLPVEPKSNTDVRYLMGRSRPVININAADGIDSYYQKMLDAFTVGNCDVYIGKGNYTYTNALIEQIRAANKRGVPIGNGCRYYFETGAKLYCEYTGSNAADVVGYFSPLDSQNVGGDYEIYNLDLVAKNVCYALHDEADGADAFCKHVYKDCYLELDNTALGAEGGNSISKALGGGLGQFEEVIIENCVFKATNPARTSSAQDDASYHSANGSPVTDAKIVVTGCWFMNRFRTSDLTNVATQAPYPRIIFTGNSSGVNVNIPSTWTKYAWNNETRT